jgi:MFS family permease
LPKLAEGGVKPKITDILSKPQLRKVTLLLAFAYMFHTITFYYILKWSPQIVADFGYTPAQAASVLTWANIGGATGGFLFGFLMSKWDIKRPTIAMLLIGSIAVAAFGIAKDSLWGWRMATFLTGFFTNAAIVGFYAAYARGFPAYARATGTGLVLGVGRFGAAGSPILAGLLFTTLGKEQLLTVSIIMAAGSILAAVLLFVLPLRDADRDQMAEAGA